MTRGTDDVGSSGLWETTLDRCAIALYAQIHLAFPFCLKVCRGLRMASASSSHSAPAPCLDTLPADILIAILRLLPVVPRIRTIARLNKRWREFAYRSIDSFNGASVEWTRSACAKALARLSSLTSLDIGTPVPMRLPSTLQHLSVWANSTLKLTGRLPQLSSLSLLTSGHGVAPLLASLDSALRSLRLSSKAYGDTTEIDSFLKSAYLPSLTALSIGIQRTNIDDLIAFYVRHATQLLELTVEAVPPDFIDTIVAQTLPSVRTLNWHLPQGRPSEPRVLESVLSHCPQLTSLHAVDVPEPVPIAVFALQSLYLSHGNLVSANRETLPRFTRLSSLRVRNLTPLAIQLLGERVTQVTACDFTATTDNSTPLKPLHPMRRLQRLHLTMHCPSEALLPVPPLTNLTKLTLSASSFSEQMQTALQFVRVCPALRIIKLVHSTELQTVSDDFLRELDRRGVERLKIPDVCRGEAKLYWLTVVEDKWAVFYTK